MLKINNALIIDDKIDLITESHTDNIFKDIEYRSLMNIHNYFLKHSIPVSVINNFSSNPSEAIESISLIPRPDIVVIDLDLNSDEIIGDDDINMIGLILNKLFLQFRQYILFIYSSQSDEWKKIMPQLIISYPILNDILTSDNTIVLNKFIDSTLLIEEKLSSELQVKKETYFKRQLIFAYKIDKGLWNKEILVILFFVTCLITIINFSFGLRDNFIYIMILIIMAITAVVFIAENKKSSL